MQFRVEVADPLDDEPIYISFLESKNYSLEIEDAGTPGRIGYQNFLNKESNTLTFANCNGFCGIIVFPDNGYCEISLSSYGDDKGTLTVKDFDLESMYSAVQEMFDGKSTSN